RVCQDFLSQRWAIIANMPRHGRRLQVLVPYNYPDGRPLATVYCEFDMSSQRVIRARLGDEPPIDDRAVEYVRSQGLCLQNKIYREERAMPARPRAEIIKRYSTGLIVAPAAAMREASTLRSLTLRSAQCVSSDDPRLKQ